MSSSDTRPPGERFPIERAHIKDAAGWTPPIHRYPPAPDLADLVGRYWIPVWSMPPGASTVQRVLQYPVCQLVVAHDYARVVGVASGLGTVELAGEGWAFGVMLRPATAWLLLRRTVADLTDGQVELSDVPTVDGAALTDAVRAELAPAPSSEPAHRRAIAIVEAALRPIGPVDDEGLTVNRIVDHVETHPEVRRVAQLCEEFGLAERSLQRLTTRRLGLTPKWLIQRRRLQEAAERLRMRATGVDLAAAAADLGYADQAHFTRDFKKVTGLTPGAFVDEQVMGQ